MENTIVNEIIQLRQEASAGYLNRERSISSSASPCSDLHVCRINQEAMRNSKLAELATVALALRIDEFNGIQVEDCRNLILGTAYRYRAQECWDFVADLVATDPFTPVAVFEKYVAKYGLGHDYYGNIRNQIIRMLCYAVVIRNPYLPSTAPVNKPKRKRGYDDKGRISASSYGAGDTTKGIFLPEEPKLTVFQTDTPDWLSDFDENINDEQAALVEKTTSQLALKSSSKLRVRDKDLDQGPIGKPAGKGIDGWVEPSRLPQKTGPIIPIGPDFGPPVLRTKK